jgi:hypothetical protein
MRWFSGGASHDGRTLWVPCLFPEASPCLVKILLRVVHLLLVHGLRLV